MYMLVKKNAKKKINYLCIHLKKLRKKYTETERKHKIENNKNKSSNINLYILEHKVNIQLL